MAARIPAYVDPVVVSAYKKNRLGSSALYFTKAATGMAMWHIGGAAGFAVVFPFDAQRHVVGHALSHEFEITEGFCVGRHNIGRILIIGVPSSVHIYILRRNRCPRHCCALSLANKSAVHVA